MERHFPRIEDPTHDSVHTPTDPVAHCQDRNYPRAWSEIPWLGAAVHGESDDYI